MPPFYKLTEGERAAIREALNAIANGPFIQDWELPIRCHVNRAGYQEILKQWPELDDTQPPPDFPPELSVYYAINGALAECCYALEMEAAPWDQWFTVSRKQLIAVYNRWEELHKESST